MKFHCSSSPYSVMINIAASNSHATVSGSPDGSTRYSVSDENVFRSAHRRIVSSEGIVLIQADSIPSISYPVNPNIDVENTRQSFPSSNLQFHPVRLQKKSVCMTYLLALFLGIVGAHHFYLGRPKFGTLYVFTAGLLGLGYVVDLVRVPWLVENANLELLHPELRGRKYIMDAYLLWLPPFGLLGFHHFCLGNTCHALVYLITAGALVIGWVLDVCLVPLIWMKKVNSDCHHTITTTNDDGNGMVEMPENFLSRACPVITSPDVFVASTDGVSRQRSSYSIMLTPPPYSEVDELAAVRDSPPSYSEVLAMEAHESET